jgi:hypothetical protein
MRVSRFKSRNRAFAQSRNWREGPALQENGKYLWVYKRDAGGAWKQWRVIWNRNDPLPARGSSS